MTDAKRRLRCLSQKTAVVDDRALSHADENLIARLIFPAIAGGETEIVADVVVLRLQRQLHDRGEIDDSVCGGEMDIDLACRQIDEITLIGGGDFKIEAGPENQLRAR